MYIDSLVSEDTPAAEAIDYDAMVEQHYQALYRFAICLAGNANDAMDFTQDTYRVLLTKGDAIRNARKVKNWLFTTLYLKKLSYKEMAEVLGLPIGTVMSRLSRGKEMLSRRLQ